jgi:phage baseplate assembly protein gpV
LDRLLNALKAQGANQDQAAGVPRFGTVTSVDPTTATARVTLQPEGVLTGWLPLLTPWVGNGWGLVCPPSPGDQVLVFPQEGDAEHGLILGASWSAKTTPPAAPCGEFWLVHKSGSFLKLQNDGTVQIKADVYVTGTVQVTGDVRAAGDVYDSHGALSALRAHYNAHLHPPIPSTTSMPD